MFFPYSRISQVPIKQIQDRLILVFTQWGLPQKLKFDNGSPFGIPKRDGISVMTLWLIGMGISVHFNRPRRPTDNASVERMQGISANWAEALKAPHIEILQQRLDAVAFFQRHCFPSRTCGNKTRIQAYPALNQIKRPFQPQNFNFEQVQDFIQLTNWKRKVGKTGRIQLFNKGLQIGYQYKRQWVVIKYHKQKHVWQCFNSQAQLIKEIPAHFCKNSILTLKAFQKTKMI